MGDVRSMPVILFVDDNEEILTLGKKILEGSGTMTVDTVTSTTMAIGKLNRGKYDAILSGNHLPALNGIGLLHHVRTEFGDVPFILFTNDDTKEEYIGAPGGADICIKKSLEPKHQFITIGFMIRHIIELKRTRDKQRELQEQEK